MPIPFQGKIAYITQLSYSLGLEVSIGKIPRPLKIKGKQATIVTDPYQPEEVGLKFPKHTEATIVTASANQVREGISTRHVGAWRRYAEPLSPLRVASYVIGLFAALQMQMAVVGPFVTEQMKKTFPALREHIEKNPPWYLPDNRRSPSSSD